MDRRTSITAAAAASLTLLAGAAGMTLSSNVVGAGANASDETGQLSAVTTATNPPITVYVDEQPGAATTIAPALPSATVTTAPTVRASLATPLTTSAASGVSGDDDEYEDDDHEEYEDHERGDDDSEYEDDDHDEHEYEGGDDDD